MAKKKKKGERHGVFPTGEKDFVAAMAAGRRFCDNPRLVLDHATQQYIAIC